MYAFTSQHVPRPALVLCVILRAVGSVANRLPFWSLAHSPQNHAKPTQDRNIILALTYEYRAPSAEVIRKAVQESGNPSAPVNWNSRYVGLVVIPGAHVRKIEFEESTMGGQSSTVTV